MAAGESASIRGIDRTQGSVYNEWVEYSWAALSPHCCFQRCHKLQLLASRERRVGHSGERRKERKMTHTKSGILRGFFEEVLNERRLDLLPRY
jgi:hypothetical protein